MKNRIRLLVYSALAVPVLAAGLYVGSFNGHERDSFFQDYRRNVARLFTGDWEFAEFAIPDRGGQNFARGPGRSNSIDLDTVFDHLDADGNGMLTHAEVGARLRSRLMHSDEQQVRPLSREEFKRALRNPPRLNGADELGNQPIGENAQASSSVVETGATTGHLLSVDQLFDPNRVVEIKIDLTEEDWQTLCLQSRDFRSAVENPLAKPYSYFKGDVTIDGVLIREVGIRKKGFIGSQDVVRPSLKIKLGEYVDQEPIEGLNLLTLNNNKQDRSLVSQFLTYQLFREAGVAAPRCSYATVTVNGRYLGIYSHVESPKKPFLQHAIGNDSGNLYEGTLTDFYPKSIEWFEVKTSEEDVDRTKLKDLATLLDSGRTLAADEIDAFVNVDSFLRHWAIESLINFWDGYNQNQNNFFVYDNPSDGKLQFIPWGADSCFGNSPRFMRRSANGSKVVSAVSILAHRLYRCEGVPERYRRILMEVLSNAWDEQHLLAETDRIERLLFDHVDVFQLESVVASVEVRRFIRERREEIMAELAVGWPVELNAEPRKPMYVAEVGFARGTFSTNRSTSDEDQYNGVGTVTIMLEGDSFDIETAIVRLSKLGGATSIVFTGQQDYRGLSLTLLLEDNAFPAAPGQKLVVVGQLHGPGYSTEGQRVRGVVTVLNSANKSQDSISGEFELALFETRGGFVDRGR